VIPAAAIEDDVVVHSDPFMTGSIDAEHRPGNEPLSGNLENLIVDKDSIL